MDRALASAIAHRWHPVAAPVSDATLHRLLGRLGPVGRVLDLGCVSSAEEWDDYEWSWTGSLTDWALTEADGADRAAALSIAGTHREEWLSGYRGQLGFATLVLHDRDGAEA